MVKQGILRIVEFLEFPFIPYSTISYPWRGVSIESAPPRYTFDVEGATDGDPVGIDTLKHACAASLLRGCRHLWLDRLCIMQTDRTDKNWQIRHMYSVYQSCRLCIVLAGGIQRLVRLDEETSWIHRSWTLQEALAPPEIVVLFDWGLGPGTGHSHADNPRPVEEVIPGESAIMPLPAVLHACTVGYLSFTPSPSYNEDNAVLISASMFCGSAAASTPTRTDGRHEPEIFSPSVVALAIAMDPVLGVDRDIRAHAVWQSALMRTSSRPVDMVFSIMGIFGVTLDPAAFHKDDRRGAAIALAQAILKAGGRASWLGSAFHIEPEHTLSTFPTFPKTSVAGAAFVEVYGVVHEVAVLASQTLPVYPLDNALVPLPTGTMDDMGYFTFRARAVRLTPRARLLRRRARRAGESSAAGETTRSPYHGPLSKPEYTLALHPDKRKAAHLRGGSCGAFIARPTSACTRAGASRGVGSRTHRALRLDGRNSCCSDGSTVQVGFQEPLLVQHFVEYSKLHGIFSTRGGAGTVLMRRAATTRA